MKKNVTVQMQSDVEARPIALLVQTANQFKSQIYLEVGAAKVNAKSIMGVMSLALLNGTQIVIDAEGEDEAEAVNALETFLKK